MSLFSYFRISKPSAEKVPAERVDEEYKRLRTRTFWGVTTAYIFYYVCRMTLGVVKQPVIDGGVLSAGELGVIGSIFYFVYAAGKFSNGFIADYCNIRRFMAWGLGISAVINVTLGILGLLHGPLGIGSLVMLLCFAILWGVNGWVQSMGSPPGTISLSRWFPLNKRGTMYSIFSSTPSFGKAVTMIATGFIVAWAGWQWGFIAAAAAGVIGTIIGTRGRTAQDPGPETDEGAPEVGVPPSRHLGHRHLQRLHLHHPARGERLGGAVPPEAEDLLAGERYADHRHLRGLRRSGQPPGRLDLRPPVPREPRAAGGHRRRPHGRDAGPMAFSVVFCIVAGLMALDFVPRKATGAALGIVGISSYAAAGLQSIVSGFLIEGNAADGVYNFGPVSIFWIIACLIAFILPVVGWKYLRTNE